MFRNSSRVQRTLRLWGLLFSLALPGISQLAADDLPQGIRDAGRRRASQKGVDRHNNLWSLNDRSGSFSVVSPSGELIHQQRFDPYTQVDYDAQWGTLILAPMGNSVEFRPVGGEAGKTIVLPDSGFEVCWLDARRFAVAPKYNGYRFEIWDLERGERLAGYGSEEKPRDGPGFIRIRRVLLRFDPERQRLWSLETYTGSVEVWTLAGEKLNSWVLASAKRDSMDLRFIENDRKMKAKDEREETTFDLWSSLELRSEGSALLLNFCEESSATFRKFHSDGAEEIFQIDVDACSKQFTLWKDWVLFYSHPNFPENKYGVRRLK